jgi:hypothetical protein
MSTYSYEHIYTHPTPMNAFEKLSQLDLKIHEIDHLKRLTVDVDVASY